MNREGIDLDSQIEQVRTLRNTMFDLQATADLLERIPTDVLIAPLTTTIENVSRFEPDYLGFYAPAVLALLLQHIAVTFSSLSLVRERLLGAEEVFRVAPITPWEIITGKYMSYSLLNLTIAAVLSFLIVFLMGVPFFGSLAYFILVLILLTAASLGWGFFISLFSNRESQSVQLSMLILIAFVFFSGFFLPLFGLQARRPRRFSCPARDLWHPGSTGHHARRPCPCLGHTLSPGGSGVRVLRRLHTAL